MVTQSFQRTGISLPLTAEYRGIAQRFAQACPFPEKAQQIRRNTLAVCAVNAYLQLMHIPTQLRESDSWNSMMHTLADVADLKVPGVGTLSCRAIAPQDTVCYVPPEDWHDRAGYVAVVIDEAADQATLLGFTPTVAEEAVPLVRFEPIEALIDQVHSLRTASVIVPSAAEPAGLTRLSQWMEGAIASTWQAVDALINPDQMTFAFRSTAELASSQQATDISRAKLINLGLQLGESTQIALVVHLTQTAAALDSPTDIILQVRPVGESPYLPEGLALTVLDEQNTSFMSATSRAIDNYIQLRLSGQSGEMFGVQIALEENTFTEQFVI